jgi:diguanylate cyclase (GGDEF)-like protein
MRKAGIGTWIRDNENDLVRLDESMIHLWGMQDSWKAGEWISFTENMLPLISQLSEEHLNKLQNLFTGKESDNFLIIEHAVNKPDGTIIYCEVRIEVHSRNETGLPLIITGVNIDTTNLIKAQKKAEELNILATLDHMTGLYNRRFFSDSSKNIFLISKRNKSNLSVAMIDIDNFKNINDTYGHSVGDKVIIALSKEMKNLTRNSDIVCRWGGEEFIILFPETSIKGATHIATTIKDKIQNLTINTQENKSITISVSIGVSEVNFKHNLLNLESTISNADNALYEAKTTGKNKVCIYN